MTTSTCTSRRRRTLHSVLHTAAALLLAAMIAGLVGLIVRDRIRVIALLMYAPLLPLGAAAVLWDLVARGRSLPRARFALGTTGIFAIGCSLLTTLGTGLPPAPNTPGVTPLTVVQWNVRWGGGGAGEDGSPQRWNSICRDIAGQLPDIVILSECPRRERLDDLQRTLGPTWTSVRSEHTDPARYFYRLVVLAPWPVTLEREAAIPTGRVMQAIVAAPGGDVRVLVVDGESHPRHDRTPRLHAVAQICREAERLGKPIDLIAGDFNAVGRSIGFDAIADAGFVSAGHSGAGWRATWPAICPLYDIDHVWIESAWSILAVERFTNRASDHRGLVTRIDRYVR